MLRANHSYKVGRQHQAVHDTRTQTQFQLYTFPSVTRTWLRRAASPVRLHDVFHSSSAAELRVRHADLRVLRVRTTGRLTPNIKAAVRRAGTTSTPRPRRGNAPVTHLRCFPQTRNNVQPRVGSFTRSARRPHGHSPNSGLMYGPADQRDVRAGDRQRRHRLRASAAFQPTNRGRGVSERARSGVGARPTRRGPSTRRSRSADVADNVQGRTGIRHRLLGHYRACRTRLGTACRW